MKSKFAELSKDREKLVRLASASSDDSTDRTDRDAVASYLSHFEFVASSIHSGAMDGSFYKNWHKTVYVSVWKKAKGFVEARRSVLNQPTMYVEFERLANKWSK